MKLRKFDIVRTDRRYVNLRRQPRKHLISCSSISDKWQKTLKTPKKVAGRVGKEGVLGGINRL